ncbi:Hint domain-containing protein [uncultured Ruegeria sp.]|uniref:Hint domain-containing protein n=1 Tax=uncultured Ruegeria sp. TaxID=259304 RepID=UPI002602B06E|nr:Hint domain-containing protein [uncultured Ruegeria sp.]
MANYSYIGYTPGVITVNTIGPDTVTLDVNYDPDTDRRLFSVQDAAGGFIQNGGGPPIADTGDVFNGDRFDNEDGDDLTQTGTVTTLDGSTTFLSGSIYLEESYILSKPGGGTITVYRVEVDGSLGGYITSEPLVPGTTYSMNIVNVTPTNAPDTTDPNAIIDVPCFVAGTLIRTPDGDVAIETLSAGDEVLTLDHGIQRIRWIGARSLDASDLAKKPMLCPIRIAAGSLGCNLPNRDLLVSPQHRMMLRSSIAVRMFDSEEVLVPARKLVSIPGISVEETVQDVTYYHILFEQHEIVFAEGAPSESLYTGAQALKGFHPEALAEIAALFPELTSPDHNPVSARPIPKRGKQILSLMRRHIKNDKALIRPS